ncbi:MAG: hypothetical protein ACRDZU_12875 [Acidimicrobiales bacterium]
MDTTKRAVRVAHGLWELVVGLAALTAIAVATGASASAAGPALSSCLRVAGS